MENPNLGSNRFKSVHLDFDSLGGYERESNIVEPNESMSVVISANNSHIEFYGKGPRVYPESGNASVHPSHFKNFEVYVVRGGHRAEAMNALTMKGYLISDCRAIPVSLFRRG